MVLPPLYAIRSHPFRNLRHPNAAHTLCGLHGRFIFAFKICMLWHICQTVHIEIFTRSSSYTDGVGVANLVHSLTLSLFPVTVTFRVVSPKFNPSTRSPWTIYGPAGWSRLCHAAILYRTPNPSHRGTSHYECNFWNYITRCDVKSRLHRGFLAVQGERK